MKALSGYAEWFWLMAKNWKDYENRGWPLRRYFRPMELPVRVYLHASKQAASEEEIEFIANTLKPETRLIEFMATDFAKYRGKIIGEITITGDIQVEGRQPVVSPWLFGPFGFFVKDGTLYDKPIPYRGQLGFFDVSLAETSR